MSNAEELIRLDDLVIAGDRELVPVGPEIAGYLVLEAALRVRDVGGGVVSAAELAIDLAGNVVLVAPPRRADEPLAALSLRQLLGALLEIATSSTPALRACAKRKGSTGLIGLVRELEGALIPLNRAASRRGVARIARETWELIEAGELELDEDPSGDDREDSRAAEASPSPPPVVHAVREAKVAPRKPAAAPPREAREPRDAPEIDVPSLPPPVARVAPAKVPRTLTPPPPTALATETASTRPTLFDDQTPETAPAQFLETGPTPTPLDRLAAEIEATAPAHDEEPFEVVSQLPPPVAEAGALADGLDAEHAEHAAPAAVSPETMRAADHPSVTSEPDRTDVEGTEVAPTRERRAGPDRVRALAEAFQVSRCADDPSLSRALKQMVGVETSRPPQVAIDMREVSDPGARVTVRLGRRGAADAAATSAESATSVSGSDDAELPEVDVDHPAPPRRLRRAAASFGLIALAAAATFFLVKAAPLGRATAEPPAPPAAQAGASATKQAAAATVGQLPATCEGTLTIEGVAEGSEVVRKLGAAPLTATLPARTALDLVAVAEGRPPHRARLDASTAWLSDAAGPHLDLTLQIPPGDGRAAAKWPARAPSTSALRAGDAAPRGLVRIRSNPETASIWLTVDPRAIPVPCGAASDLMIVAAGGASRSLRVEWSAFTGFPAKATTKAP